MTAAAWTAIGSALVLAGAVFKWFISPDRKKEEDEKNRQKESDTFVKAVATGDAGAVYDNLKRLRDKASRRRLSGGANKKG